MKDPDVNTFLFNDSSFYNAQQRTHREAIVMNSVYVVSCIMLWACLLVTSHDVALLYVCLQVFICCYMQKNMSKADKVVLITLGILYYFVNSTHAKNLVYYTLFSLPVFSYKSIEHKISQTTNVDFKVLNFVFVYFIGFWSWGIVSFTRSPTYIDAVLIPATFYYDVNMWKSLLTELSTKEKPH